MLQSYKKLIEMESVVSLKLEQDKKAMDKIQNILYQEKEFILNKLEIYLKKETGNRYFQYKLIDIDNNIVDVFVKKDSKIFTKNIQGKDYLNFNAENLIDIRMFDNQDDIIITDFNSNENKINLAYLCDTLDYKYLSYSDSVKYILSTFINYVINKNINSM